MNRLIFSTLAVMMTTPLFAVEVAASCESEQHRILIMDYGLPGWNLKASVHQKSDNQDVAYYDVVKKITEYVDLETNGEKFRLLKNFAEFSQNKREFVQRLKISKLECEDF